MDEIQILEQMCNAVPTPDPDHLARLRAGVLDRTVGDRRAGTLPRRARVLSARRARLAFAGCALAATAALIATLVSAAGGGRASPAPSADAVQILQHAATVALTEPIAADGQFVYAEIIGHSRFGPLGNRPTTEQIWQPASGSAGGVIELSPCRSLTPGSLTLSFHAAGGRVGLPPVPAARCAVRMQTSDTLPAVASYAGLQTLPTRASALLAYVAAHVVQHEFGAAGYQLDWEAITDILRDNPAVPPRIAAAMFRAAASIPGTTVLQHVTDAAGRPGIAVARQDRGVSTELIFNPVTYDFAGSADVVTSDVATGQGGSGQPIGTVFYTMAVLHTAIVKTAPSAGPGSYQPAVSYEFRA